MSYYFGIDVGGTNIKGIIGTETGDIIVSDLVSTESEKGESFIISNIIKLSDKLLKDAKLNIADVKAMGIGFPGMINSTDGVVTYSNNLRLNNFKVVELLKQKFTNMPIKVSNDANCAALGEFMFGAGKSFDSIVFITLGTGVGSGIIVDDKMIEGNKGAGAEIGHMVIQVGGELCTCGRRGCFEAYSSIGALIRQTKKAMLENKDSLMWNSVKSIEDVNGKLPFDYAKKDKTASIVLDNYFNYLAEGLCNITNIFRPEAILIGGAVSKQGDNLIKPIADKVDKLMFGGGVGPKVKIIASSLQNDAGALGALALNLQE